MHCEIKGMKEAQIEIVLYINIKIKNKREGTRNEGMSTCKKKFHGNIESKWNLDV